MHSELKSQVAFHLTGRRTGAELTAVETLALRPAVLAAYRDLANLRYDYPVVLVENDAEPAVVSLTALINGLLHELAPPGAEGEKLRRHLLRLEREIRLLLQNGVQGRLTMLWYAATERLAREHADIAASAERARPHLTVDGLLVDCDATLPAALLAHVWQHTQNDKAARFRKTAHRLIQRLEDILRSDYVYSAQGQSAASLKAAVGGRQADIFDFEAMSRLLGKALPRHAVPQGRKARIEWALATLRQQRFHALPEHGRERDARSRIYNFVFDTCSGALKAYRDRLGDLVELAKALAVAELEIDGLYVDAQHDAFFRSYSADLLDAGDLALFPDYLVRLKGGSLSPAEHERVTELVATPLPMKVLVQSDDLLDVATATGTRPAFSLRDLQYARYAMECHTAYVVQAPASQLYASRECIAAAMRHAGPALFNVYSGLAGGAGALPPYLDAAAAHASRAFPAYAYDPTAGDNLASRFDLDANPDVERDWPVQPFAYEDDAHQTVNEELAFTFLDFVACDPRHAAHFARVPRAQWNDAMAPAFVAIACSNRSAAAAVPYLPVIDEANTLHRVIADEAVMREARRCREHWRALQELSGIHNSHAERLLAREKAVWAAQQTPATVTAAAAPPPAAEAAPPTAAVPEERRSDEAYIETVRCSSCNECTQLNPRMFAYDGNKQAYIKDLTAGSYRELVEAAESCQVSVIHPGRPRDPNEPGLAELLERAQPFL